MQIKSSKNLIEGEIIIDFPIIINDQGAIEGESKNTMKKCPHCCTGVGRDFTKYTDEGIGKVEISFSCGSCSKRWLVRFQKPFREVLL